MWLKTNNWVPLVLYYHHLESSPRVLSKGRRGHRGQHNRGAVLLLPSCVWEPPMASWEQALQMVWEDSSRRNSLCACHPTPFRKGGGVISWHRNLDSRPAFSSLRYVLVGATSPWRSASRRTLTNTWTFSQTAKWKNTGVLWTLPSPAKGIWTLFLTYFAIIKKREWKQLNGHSLGNKKVEEARFPFCLSKHWEDWAKLALELRWEPMEEKVFPAGFWRYGMAGRRGKAGHDKKKAECKACWRNLERTGSAVT